MKENAKDEVTGYELANRLIRSKGIENPEELSDMERFDIVLKHICGAGNGRTVKNETD